MKMKSLGVGWRLWLLVLAFILAGDCSRPKEKASGDRDDRMAWWREARFGLFIHWGLYAIPAGEWNGETSHAEWIRTTARIPLEVYDRFVGQFNPVNFDADEWVRLAAQAGMSYIVITSKHHDGFCLFDSRETDFDIASTPFRRDILRELSDACRRAGIRLCFYHSIMDWHHPDYLPRRDWETDRPAEGAEFDRYVRYLKSQLAELLENYGRIGVLWFDGEWENTWNHERGRDLYSYVRGLQPGIIVNNRVDVGRSGMAGLTREGSYAGDFGTPEQEIPATGLPGVDWETCLTMNDHWGYNKADQNWKSAADLIRRLADIASKGGNFLLNVGPTAEGAFPQPAVDRLKDIGAWLRINGDSIYGTQAGPFKSLAWGRCTQRPVKGGSRLYLHVFDWPSDGRLILPGLSNRPRRSYFLADPQKRRLKTSREEDAVVLALPEAAPDPVCSVVVLELVGKPDVNDPPTISAAHAIFIDELEVEVSSGRENVEVRYTLDGSTPDLQSPLAQGPILLTSSVTLSARCFRDGEPASGASSASFTRVEPRPAVPLDGATHGLGFAYYEGDWDRLPNLNALRPVKIGVGENVSLGQANRPEHFGFLYLGFIRSPADGVYTFFIESDDGSRLSIGNEFAVENDGLHGLGEARGEVALAAGFHPLRVEYFNKTGASGLTVSWAGPGMAKKPIPSEALFYSSR